MNVNISNKELPPNLRPAWLQIDLDAIAHNTRQIKIYLGDVELLAVVKADGYGLGAVHCAPVILANGADRLGVVILDGAIELRRAGIQAPILNLGGILPKQADIVLEHNLEQMVHSQEVAQALSQAAARKGMQAKVHLKIDTGMGRYGLRFDKAVSWIKSVIQLANLDCLGVMTHFPMSDELDKSFALLQIHRFRDLRRQLESGGIHIPTWHMANSGATVDLPQSHFDMVRVGLMLYGYFPSKHVRRPFELCPAISLKAKIVSLKTIQRGESVGYGRRFIAENEERVAVLPLGYSDGYDRRLTQIGSVLIKGRRAPIIGGICMDACFVKVTEFKDVRVGNIVTLMGRQGEEEISPHDIADEIGSVSYEIISRFSKRLPRVYVQDGKVVDVKSVLSS